MKRRRLEQQDAANGTLTDLADGKINFQAARLGSGMP